MLSPIGNGHHTKRLEPNTSHWEYGAWLIMLIASQLRCHRPRRLPRPSLDLQLALIFVGLPGLAFALYRSP